MRLYHGTSVEAFLKIWEEGFKFECCNRIWEDSDFGGHYFYHPEKCAQEGSDPVENAFYNAGFAIIGTSDLRRVVIEIDWNGDIYDDDSGDGNMVEACCIYEDIPPSCIKSLWVDGHPLNMFYPMLVQEFMSRNNTCKDRVSEFEQKLAETMTYHYEWDAYDDLPGKLHLPKEEIPQYFNLHAIYT